jgi:threonine dehydratase
MASTDVVPDGPMANGVSHGVNGSSTSASRPYTPQRTPSISGLSLTEHSLHMSSPTEEKRARLKKIVPEEFLLPSGYPDVCGPPHSETRLLKWKLCSQVSAS